MTFTIRLNLKRASGKRSAVLAVVRHEGRKYVLGTGVSVDVDDWSQKRERCKLDEVANQKIGDMVKRIRTVIDETGKVPLREELEKAGKETILEAIEAAIERVISSGGANNSWRGYQTLGALVRRYTEAEKRREEYLSEISVEWIEGLIRWMIGQNYATGHTSKMVKMLRSAIREKVPEGKWRKAKPPKNQVTEMVYLQPDEIEKLEALQFEKGDKLERVRDMFLVGCYTALRYSDWRKVDWTRTQVVGGVKVLTVVQQKTGGHTTLPIGARLGALMDKYRVEGWPVLSVQKFNKSVKELCKVAGIVQQVSVTEYRGGKTVVLTGQKWEFVSSHTARRSFATNAVLAGIPVSEVMKFTGHKSISAFFQYIRTTGQEAAVAYSGHPFFSSK